MADAPIGSAFVWVHDNLYYPKSLAVHIGREDLMIVGPSHFDDTQWRGRRYVAIEVDHAARLTDEQAENIKRARTLTRR